MDIDLPGFFCLPYVVGSIKICDVGYVNHSTLARMNVILKE